MTDNMSRIMVIDSSAFSRQILTNILQHELPNIEVTACKNGLTALKTLQQSQHDLITTALMLPDMDGLALSRQIRDSRRHHYTPVIVVSGDADERLLREGFEAGVTDYFDKSHGYHAFSDFIKSFLQRNSGLVGHVLFVEDSQTAAAMTIKILEQQGLRVTHTTSAELAMDMIQKQYNNPDDENNFDLVITDFYLIGKMTGGDLLHAIRTRLHYSQQELPVLVLTSSDDPQTLLDVFHAGGNDFVNKPILEQVMMARVRLLLLIKHQFETLKQQAETMRWVAATDSLTGVRSKRYLLDNGEDFIRNPENHPVWGLLMDIDHFKQINDNLGHITGDHVLAELGATLNQAFPDDMVVRFGGEEFSVLIRNKTEEQVLQLAEQLRSDIEALKPVEVDISISIGLAGLQDHPDSNLTELLKLADQALYHSKETGRNRVSIYTRDKQILSPFY